MDATHLAEFFQVEGVVADYDITLGNLIGEYIDWHLLARPRTEHDEDYGPGEGCPDGSLGSIGSTEASRQCPC
jgi:hypothetical protein